ncbi:hypothetical protein HDV01_004893 [Terramyces sp. JEL0728]|nr:hypothetical protein HDV01_004893 [Terramyces sp. JEL0728]
MSVVYFEVHNAEEEDALLINLKFQEQFPDYIWHNEPFRLKVKSTSCLEGSIDYGDAIEDEWITVYFLRQLSIENLNYCIKIWDSDGEFLLIEAADFLPKDINPEIIDHRVYIYQGHLHLIPLEYQNLTLEKALKVISGEQNTQADEKIEKSAFKRIENYPSLISSNYHHAKVFVPHLAAHLLYHCPQLVAPAIEAFYARDPISMRPCSEMKVFPPSTNIPMTVKFTKVLYSKLYSTPFVAPKQFSMPAVSDSNYEACYLGMKLACGLEILYHSKLSQKLTDSSNPKFLVYISKLEALGYFRGEIQGSNLYNQLEKMALKEFISMESQNQYLTGEMHLLLDLEQTPVELIPNFKQDSNSWMQIAPEEVDDLLQSKSTDMSEDEISDLDEQEEKELNELKSMLGGFNEFIDKESGVKGALLPDEANSDDSEESDGSLQAINFNADNYISLLSYQGENQYSQDMDLLYQAMDDELRNTDIGKDFETVKDQDGNDVVDANLNLIKNMLESFTAQNGSAGPTSNIIGSLGLNLPKPDI